MSQDVLLERKSSLKICLLFFILQFPKKISSRMFSAPSSHSQQHTRNPPSTATTYFLHIFRFFLFSIFMCSTLKQQQGNWKKSTHGKNSQWGFKGVCSHIHTLLLYMSKITISTLRWRLSLSCSGEPTSWLSIKWLLTKYWIENSPRFSFLSVIFLGFMQACQFLQHPMSYLCGPYP